MDQKGASVYRHYDKCGNLLYVGVTGNPLRRLDEHSINADWVCEIDYTIYKWFDARASALEEECRAINCEEPRHNKSKPSVRSLKSANTVVMKILEEVGNERAAEALGVPVSTVLRARWRDRLPAAWLDALEEAAMRPLPRAAFSFKRAADSMDAAS